MTAECLKDGSLIQGVDHLDLNWPGQPQDYAFPLAKAEVTCPNTLALVAAPAAGVPVTLLPGESQVIEDGKAVDFACYQK